MSVEDRYIIRGGLEGRERLRVLARAMYPTTTALLDRVGIVSGMSCLDVGCGGGDVTRELARRVAPGGHVVGLDSDATKLEIARHEAGAPGELEYVLGDILTTDLQPEYDAIYARFLLTHGSFCHPASAAYQRYCELYTQAAGARGVDPNIGPRLPQLLAGAGCGRVRMNAVQPAGMTPEGDEADVKLAVPLTVENNADAAIAEGLTTRDEVDSIAAELHRLAADPTTVLAFPRIVQAWGHVGAGITPDR